MKNWLVLVLVSCFVAVGSPPLYAHKPKCEVPFNVTGVGKAQTLPEASDKAADNASKMAETLCATNKECPNASFVGLVDAGFVKKNGLFVVTGTYTWKCF